MTSSARCSRSPKQTISALWHVGDPPEFWSERTVPQWARQRGWWYDDTHPPKSQIDAEIFRVFERHPRLRLILPHFFFMSDRLDDAAELLESLSELHARSRARRGDAPQLFRSAR
jgi:hypothetical protein